MNILNTFFDKIYIITCREDIERRSNVKRQLDMFDIKNVQYQISIPPENLVEKICLSRQDLSLILSHVNCVIDAHINGYDKILILEDDFQFENNFEYDFKNIINNIPMDWEYIHLGIANWTKTVFTQKSGEPVNEFIEKYIFAPGSHCVGIKSSCFQFIIDNFLNYEMPIDLIYEKILSTKYKCYISKKSICDAKSVPHQIYWNMIPNFNIDNFCSSKIRDFSKTV